MMETGATLLRRLLRQQYRLLTVSVILAITAAALELLPYWLIYRMAQVAAHTGFDSAALGMPLILLFGAAIARLIVFGLANIASHTAAFRIQKNLRIDLLRRLAKIPTGAIEGRSGDLKKTIVDDVASFDNFIGHTIPDMVAGLALALLATLLLFFVDWRMALASLALLPVAAIAQRLTFRNVGPILARWHAADVTANSGLLAYIRGISTLRAFNRTATSLQGLREAVSAIAALSEEVTRQTAIPYALFFVALATNLVIVVPVGLLLHIHGGLGIDQFILFALLGAGLTTPLLRIVHAAAALRRLLQGGDRMAALLNTPDLPAPAIAHLPKDMSVTFDRVHFGYGDGPDVVHGVSVVLPDTRVSALVGPSGSGKSTLMRLAARFADVRQGAIRLGGVDVRAIAPERLSALVSLVFQQPQFFNGTIRENLIVARPDASTDKIDQAIEAAGLAPLLSSLPQGLETALGDRAARLSGGERQRLAIARALLKDAPLLILDEATAFADAETELAVQRATARLTIGRTVLVVAHRLVTVQEADRIVALNDGRVDGIGTHAQLLTENALYRGLWNSQWRAQQWRLRDSNGMEQRL